MIFKCREQKSMTMSEAIKLQGRILVQTGRKMALVGSSGFLRWEVQG